MPIQNRKSKIQNPKGRVIVVGSSNTDLVVHCKKLPQAGETVLGGDLLTFAGGKGANQAVAAARAGAKVYFIGAFGDDAFGRARRADLEKEGIDCSGCVVKKGVPSGVALIAIGEGKGRQKAENVIVVAPGANARLTAEDVRRGMPKNLTRQDVLLCSLEVPLKAVAAAMRAAGIGRRRAITILNPAPMPPHSLPKALLQCHYMTPNEREFEAIVGAKVGSAAATRSAGKIVGFMEGPLPYPEILVTRSARGVDAYYYGFYEECHAVPPRVEAVDTVGAGDCFSGCFAAGMASIVTKEYHGNNYYPSVRFAVAAAAIKVTRRGAQAGMPYRREILRMLKRMTRD